MGESSQSAGTLPGRAAVRRLLQALLRTDADLNAFCGDYFPAVDQRFAQGMDREDKVSLLLKLSNPGEVVARLRERYQADGSALATIEQHLAQPQTDAERKARDLWDKLEPLCLKREQLLQAGENTDALDSEIRRIKREQRQGSQLPEGEVLKDRYRLIEVIGSGGFGRVWKAFDRIRQQSVAIKILHSEQGDVSHRLERFTRGASQMQKLDHRHIVRLLDGPAEHNGFHYLVMDYLAGGDLFRGVLKGTLDRKSALRAVLQTGDALAYAHKRGLIHRDVKPQNILLDGAGEARLTDFDLVWAADTTGGTGTGAMGTFLFSAPEEMEDASRLDQRADIYALGMTTLFVLHGKNLSRSVLDKRQLFIDALDCPERVKALLRITTAPDPDDRPQTMEDFCRELDAALQGDGQTIPPIGNRLQAVTIRRAQAPSLPTQSRRWLRWFLPALLLVVIIVGSAFKWRPRPRPIDREAAATQILLDVEGDLQARRWADVIEKTRGLIYTPGFSTKKLVDAAVKNLKRAEEEAKSQQIYERFSRAAGAGSYDQAMRAYHELPEDSVYRQLARQQYDQIFPIFAENHLKVAEAARVQGRCDEFQSHLEAVLKVDSGHVKALSAKVRSCNALVDVANLMREAKAKLTGAEADYSKGYYFEAMILARSAANADLARASRIIGLSACHLNLRGQAREAYVTLTGSDKALVLRACQANHISADDLLNAQPDDPDNGAIDSTLSDAQTEYVNGNFKKAIEIAQSVQGGSPVRALRIIGSAACNIKDLQLVNDAYRRLDQPGQQYLVYVCERNAIRQVGNKFRLSE